MYSSFQIPLEEDGFFTQVCNIFRDERDAHHKKKQKNTTGKISCLTGYDKVYKIPAKFMVNLKVTCIIATRSGWESLRQAT